MRKILVEKRKQLDKIDKKLIRLLEKRFKIVYDLKKWKKKEGIRMEDKARERAIVDRFDKSKLSKRFVKDFFNSLFREAKR